MKVYKTYFDKKDTPFTQDFQKHKKYHVVWKRRAYATFLGHNVLKVKLLGIFTIKGNSDPVTLMNNMIKEFSKK